MPGYKAKKAKADSKYRFAKGTQILCRTGAEEWSAGLIVAIDYREDHWPAGRVAPYQVRLRNGGLIFAPADVDEVCRELVLPWWSAAFKEMPEFYAQRNPDAKDIAKMRRGKSVDEPDHEGTTALMEAVIKSWPKAVELLLSLKADVNIAGKNKARAIHMARQPNIIKMLIDARADVNCQDMDADYDPDLMSATFGERLEHRTPLHYACSVGDVEATKVLLEARASLDVQDSQWKTPLHLAIDEDQIGCVDLLLTGGANVNLGNQESGMDNTPLMDAAAEGKTDLVFRLIAAGSDVNKQGKSKMTALHLAARNRRADAAQALLAAKADMDKESTVGTPLDLARKNGGAGLLKAFGVPVDTPSPVRAQMLDASTRAALFMD